MAVARVPTRSSSNRFLYDGVLRLSNKTAVGMASAPTARGKNRVLLLHELFLAGWLHFGHLTLFLHSSPAVKSVKGFKIRVPIYGQNEVDVRD